MTTPEPPTSDYRLLFEEARREIDRLNQQLEQRTRDVEAANSAIQSFSYSVSHDLRAPLRTIDGFSQILVEDYSEKLDEEGQFLISRVRSGTARMGELIEDLLKLSRLGRTDMSIERLNLSELANEVAAELHQASPEREVDLVIASGLEGSGDRTLVRLVLQNLIENSWKFTSKRERARIEFGLGDGDEPTWFVRDDGAGFEMTQSQKLFGVFQRMHPSSEFPGNGAGLAIVQRIIHRHGGRVWAEAAEDAGATFYFTLAPSPAILAEGQDGEDSQGGQLKPPVSITKRRLEQAG